MEEGADYFILVMFQITIGIQEVFWRVFYHCEIVKISLVEVWAVQVLFQLYVIYSN